MNIYTILKRMIERKNYDTKENLALKMDVFFAVTPPRLTAEQYAELNELLFAEENTEVK